MTDNKFHDEACEIETHPWPPFIPPHAKVLIMGTFPPGKHRWSMDFYYPNRTNDFWKVCGLIFYGSKDALLNPDGRSYNLPEIKNMLTDKGIALNDTGRRIKRLKGNASDKYLEIVEPVDLHALLERMPECRDVATTGEKAAAVVAQITATPVPAMGACVPGPDGLRIWRMPSTSRAFPMSVEKKAEFYRALFLHI